MSAEATGWVWRSSPYVGARLLVHLAVADIVNDAHDNEFWMSTAKLAEKARVARSTAIATLGEMVDAGLLEVVSAGGGSRTPTRYRFRMARPLAGLAAGESTSAATGLARPLTGLELDRSPDPIPKERTQETQSPRERERDLLFDAVCEACGYDVDRLTRTERGRVAVACTELRQLVPPPSPEDVLAFGRTWRRTASPGFACTPQAITGNWQRIMRSAEAARAADRQRRNDAGVA